VTIAQTTTIPLRNRFSTKLKRPLMTALLIQSLFYTNNSVSGMNQGLRQLAAGALFITEI